MGIDNEVAALAEQQYGVVSTAQVRTLGGDRNLIRRRCQSGRWDRPADRVVRMAGVPQTAEQRVMIALLHAGPTAVASHEAAAWLWQLPGFGATEAVSRSRSHGAAVDDRGHRPRLVLPGHRTVVRGIPCTSLPRTIFDLAGNRRHARRIPTLVDRVVTQSPAMLPALHRALTELACRGRPGITVMRQVLADRPVGTAVPASSLEARFEAVWRNAGLPELERQVDVGGHSWLGRVDFALPALGLLIEVDSVLHHTSVTDRARDRARDEAMLDVGWRRVLRITEEDVWHRPWQVVQQGRVALQTLAKQPPAVLGPETRQN